ncbi:MAG: class I SAM-dependent methyltransferase [Candidatus Aceula meridiana]|nr:class I SAM-dependent methyltransferase [Candidatus Aceula meridiana]
MIDDREGYFQQFNAPIFEATCKEHIDTVMNHSTPYYGPLLYWLVRSAGIRFAVEIGVCKGWTSYFIAAGIKDNLNRAGLDKTVESTSHNGHYYGVDISGIVVELEEKLRAKGLPATMVQKDSYHMTKEDFPLASMFHLAFIDGWHSRQHLLKEFEILYPMMAKGGTGYIVVHDVYGWVAEPMQEVLKDPRYKFEYVRFFDNYGLAILRVMDDYIEDPKHYWPQGPEPDCINEDGTYRTEEDMQAELAQRKKEAGLE